HREQPPAEHEPDGAEHGGEPAGQGGQAARGARAAHDSASARPSAPKRISDALSTRAWNSGVRISSGVRGRGRSTSMIALIRPGRGDMTATWSERKIASEMPWVTSRVVAGFSVQI